MLGARRFWLFEHGKLFLGQFAPLAPFETKKNSRNLFLVNAHLLQVNLFRQPGGMRRRVQEIVQTFRQKGATSPERAMSAQELGLPPRFEQAMKRRLGQTGIFVDIGGKYYLNEARLAQMEQRGVQGGGIWNARRDLMTLRIARMAVVVVLLITILTNLFVRNDNLWILVVGLIVVAIVLTVLQMFLFSRLRGRRSGFSAMDNSGVQRPP
jgi:hypothetical protein